MNFFQDRSETIKSFEETTGGHCFLGAFEQIELSTVNRDTSLVTTVNTDHPKGKVSFVVAPGWGF